MFAFLLFFLLMLKPVDVYPAGGVDSRSNPVNMPNGRYLLVKNFLPQQDGSFRLRDGYSPLVDGIQANVPVYSIYPVVGPGPSYKPLIVFWQNKVPYTLDPSTNTITTPTVKGTAIASSARWTYFYTNGHLYAFNGTDAKWFDGVYWRDIGLPTLTPAQQAAIGVNTGLEAISQSQASSVTLTLANGGTSSGGNRDLVYFAFFDTAQNLLMSSPLELSGAPVVPNNLPNQEIQVANLPTNSTSTVIGLLAVNTNGIGAGASFVALFSSALSGIPGSMTNGGTTVTVNLANHGLSTGNVVTLYDVTPTWPSAGPFVITKIDANNFSFQTPNAAQYTGTVFIFNLLVVPNASTTATITNDGYLAGGQGSSQETNGSLVLPYADSLSLNGVAASSIGGAQPGYQWEVSIYNKTTGHVGNRITIGQRIANTAAACFVFTGLPTFADSEWVLLFGRTSDGAEIPYAADDVNGNWITTPNNTAAGLTITTGTIDGNSELPSRNYPPPGTLDYNYQLSLLPGGAAQNPPVSGTFSAAWVESDHCCGAYAAQSPTIYRSGSALDMREGVFVGLPEQSWDPADIETFPTGAPVTCGQGYQGESWIYSIADCGVLMELAGETSWQGPWNVGCAGQYAWARGWQNMPFWVTGDKQLATVSSGGYLTMGGMMTTAASGPIIISDEYEAALLSLIGSQYLSQTEVVYIRKPAERVDVLRIHARDVNGNPIVIIHDFNLRDQNSPYGQGYLETYSGILGQSPAPTFSVVRDQNWQLQVLAGAQDGNLYELYSGSSDNGTNFTAQALALVYIGPDRTAVKYLEWYGDVTTQFFVTKDLTVAFDTSQMEALCVEQPDPVQGDDKASHYVVDLTAPEMIHAYLVVQLTSHPADGSVGLNSPPHIPLETYGRIWMVTPLAGVSRGK